MSELNRQQQLWVVVLSVGGRAVLAGLADPHDDRQIAGGRRRAAGWAPKQWI